jgi:predicted O-methyltransferase YrrM
MTEDDIRAAGADLGRADLRPVAAAPAVLTAAERLALYAAAYAARPARALEIGTYRGGSAAIIVAAMDALGAGRLACIDPAGTDHAPPGVWQAIRHRAAMVRGASPAAVPAAAAQAGGPFDFAFIDGGHAAAEVLADLAAAAAHAAPGAVFALHDVLTPSVQEGIGAFLASPAGAGWSPLWVACDRPHFDRPGGPPCGGLGLLRRG